MNRKQKNRVMVSLLQSTGAKLGILWILVMASLAVFAPFLANSMPYRVVFHDAQTGLAITQYPLFQYLSTVDVGLIFVYFTAIVLYSMRTIHFKAKLYYAMILVWICFGHSAIFSLPKVLGWLDLTALKDISPEMQYLICVGIGLFSLSLIGLICFKLHQKLTHVLEKEDRCGKHYSLIFWLVAIGLFFALVPISRPKTVNHTQYRDGIAEGIYTDAIYAPVVYSPKDYQTDFQRRMAREKKNDTQGALGQDGEVAAANRKPLELTGNYIGTENNGGDLLSRMIYATRIALSIGFISTGIAITIGIILGGMMGYFAGVVDILGMRIVEIAEAIPSLVLMIIFVSFFGKNIYMMMVIIGFTSWSGYARFTRAEFLRLRNQDFIHAAKASGLPLRSILFKHMLPNGVAPVLVQASFGVAAAILIEATLSFLGLGGGDDASWGEMLKQASDDFHWWVAIFPGGAIFLTVFSYNLIGEALRDAIDPNSKRKSQL